MMNKNLSSFANPNTNEQLSSTMRQWANIPGDLLRIINERLILYVDKVRFSCVCKSWQSEQPKLPNHSQQQNQLPWLLLPSNNGNQSTHELFNIIDKKSYYLDLHNKITPGQLFRGSSFGWLVTVEDTPPSMYLFNPLTKIRIQLPPRSTFPDVKSYCADELKQYTVWDFHGPSHGFYSFESKHVRNNLTWKIILSSDPSLSNDYLVVAIYGEACRLAYCKPGDDKWTTLGDEKVFDDIIFYKGQLYALGCRGQLMIIDDIGSCPRMTDINRTYHNLACPVYYLVESSIGLLLVGRYPDYSDSTREPIKEDDSFDSTEEPIKEDEEPINLLYKTSEFEIFKFDFDNFNWCEVSDIGDDILFIGFNTSISMSAHDFPGVQGNKIYFTDNMIIHHEEGILGGYDIGVFDLESMRVQSLPGFECATDIISPSPIWIFPSTY